MAAHSEDVESIFDATVHPELMKARHRLTDSDLELVRRVGHHIVPRLEEYVTHFYDWMQAEPEFEHFFSDTQRLRRVQRMQVDYWRSFFMGVVDLRYIRERRRVGEIHARIGLTIDAYFAAMDISLNLLADELIPSDVLKDERHLAYRALTKLVHLDTSVVVVAYNHVINEHLAGQAQAMLEMSTPVTSVAQDVLMLPIVGLIDTRRAKNIMTASLARIAETRARCFIIDISGVSVVDTAVANHLIKLTRATRLMGCRALLSGLSPAIAQTIIELGIDVTGLDTYATLRDALEAAMHAVGFQVLRRGD